MKAIGFLTILVLSPSPITPDRRLAVQYHPDKWRQDSEHGMTKDDAEEKFKEIQSAYDHLMANFDEDE